MSETETEKSKEKVILYVEDNPVNLRLITQIVESQTPYKLLLANTASMGIELAYANGPDLILLDINLPGTVDGFELLRILKTADETKDTPTIAISANALKTDIERGKRAGFDDYLTKPVNLPKFLQALDRYLK